MFAKTATEFLDHRIYHIERVSVTDTGNVASRSIAWHWLNVFKSKLAS